MTHHRGRISLRLLIMTTCAILLPHAPRVAAASAEGWRATAVHGQATVRRGEAQPQALVEGRVLEPGESLATAAEGKVVLTRGPSTITVGPNGRMEIPAGGDEGVRTRIVQAMGSLLFKVEKQASQHFEVETPYLAAVVKGTTFTVSVDGEASAVHVVDGAVEVKALATGQVGLIKPGYTAVVSQRRGGGLSVIGGKPHPAGKALKGSNVDAPVDEAEPADRAASQATGRAGAPGQVKRLHAALGEASVDVAATSKGFVRKASFGAGNGGGGVTTASLGSAEGKSAGKGVAKEKSNNGKSAASPGAAKAGAAKASAGNPGGGKAVGLAKAAPAVTKVTPAVAGRVAKSNKATSKLLAALAKAREKALKDKLKIGRGGGDDDDDDDDD
ncbi:MAG: FecR domain-containing protein [Rhodospirillales bacterium]|nr:FecR domain-containing protein [Rhodospirillales bacterium]